MTKGHLEYFKIKNFKRFDKLELDSLGQFNLITGDNNVGKTSLLEALLVDEDWEQTLWNYHRTLNIRGLAINLKSELDATGAPKEIIFPDANYLRFLMEILDLLEITFRLKNRETKTNGSPLKNEVFSLSYSSGLKHGDSSRYFDKFPPVNSKHSIRVESNGRIFDSWLHIEEFAHGPTDVSAKGFPFIPVFRGYASDLVSLYSESALNRQQFETQLIHHTRVILPEIEGVRIFQLDGIDHLFLKMKGEDKQRPLSQFGDGVVRLFSILLHLLYIKGGRLMIDEVDNGIHHSRMKGFLKNLVKMAVANEVQLFMTTHSIECQQAFAEAFEDPEMVHLQSEFCNITLVETLDHSIKPFIYNYRQLSENLELGIETRGRKLA